MDTLPEKERERESANHGNIFDRIHTLMQSNDGNSSNQQGDINSLQTHYLKTSAEADSTTGVPSDKLAKSDNSSKEAKKIRYVHVFKSKSVNIRQCHVILISPSYLIILPNFSSVLLILMADNPGCFG